MSLRASASRAGCRRVPRSPTSTRSPTPAKRWGQACSCRTRCPPASPMSPGNYTSIAQAFGHVAARRHAERRDRRHRRHHSAHVGSSAGRRRTVSDHPSCRRSGRTPAADCHRPGCPDLRSGRRDVGGYQRRGSRNTVPGSVLTRGVQPSIIRRAFRTTRKLTDCRFSIQPSTRPSLPLANCHLPGYERNRRDQRSPRHY